MRATLFDPALVVSVIALYMVVLFAVATWVERRVSHGRNPADHPLVYALSLAIYCTTWTYYGSVGKAASSGLLFLTIYLGPTLVMCWYWVLVRRMVRLKSRYHITSLADFMALRFDRSQLVGALVSLGALLGTIPYIALQLKAVLHTFDILTQETADPTQVNMEMGLWLVALMTFFTIVFGVRRIDPTERHRGMVTVVALESLVKLLALLSVGLFVVYWQFDGMESIMRRVASAGEYARIGGEEGNSGYVTWFSFLILSMAAFLFLPRQFHVAVVENSNERHLLTAMWVFPLYLVLINLFVLPVALAGKGMGYGGFETDFLVLLLPFDAGQSLLTLFAFIGGFSAATGMIMITSMTMAVMLSNYLLLPLINFFPALNWLRRHMLASRWVIVACYLLLGYLFLIGVGESFALVNIGIISFAAILQIAPAALAGLFWRQANRWGAFSGIAAGLVTWGFTLIVPAFARTGWLPLEWLEGGVFGIALLRPEALFGLSGMDPISHAVFWSLLFNIAWLIGVSLNTRQSESESQMAQEFEHALRVSQSFATTHDSDERWIPMRDKATRISVMLEDYFLPERAQEILQTILQRLHLAPDGELSIVELAMLYREVEMSLSGAIGAAASHRAMQEARIFTEQENQALSKFYGDMLARLKISPDELHEKVNFYQRREAMLSAHAQELEERVLERDQEIERRLRVEGALKDSEERLESILEYTTAVVYLKDFAGRYLLVNRRYEELFGVQRAHMVGRADADVFPAEVATRLRMNDRQVETSLEPMQFEEEIPVDGQGHTYLSIKFPLFNAAGDAYAVCGISTDITERIIAENRLKRDNEMKRVISGVLKVGLESTSLRQKLQSCLDLILSVDCFSFSESGSVFLWSPDRQRLQMIAHRGLDREIIEQCAELPMGRCLCGRAAESLAMVTYPEITDAHEISYPGMPPHGHCCMPIVSDQGLLGVLNLYTPAGHVADEDEHVFLDSVARALAITIEHQQAEDEIHRINAELEQRVEKRTSELQRANHALAESLETLTTTQARLLQTEKMAALGGLVAGVAHEINTPIGVGVTAASHLEHKSRSLQEAYAQGQMTQAAFERYLEIAQESSRMILANLRRASEHISSFKQVAVDQASQERRRFKLAEYLDEVLMSLHPKIKKTGHRVEVNCPEHLELDSYPGAYSQIITNLVVNALVHAFDEPTSGLIRIDVVPLGDELELRFSDNGKGMDEEQQRHIFEPFYTTRRAQGGSGLGLHILYNLVTQQLQGSIECRSELGGGTEFLIRVPIELRDEAHA